MKDQYGIYKVIMSDGFRINVNASNKQSAIDSVLRAGIVNAPISAFKSVTLIRAIPLTLQSV